MNRVAFIAAIQLSLRAALAAALAVAVAEWLSLPFPLYALVAAIVVTDLSASETRRLAVPRLAGTVLGAALGIAIVMVLHPSRTSSPWVSGMGVLFAMLLSHILGLKDAAKVAGYVCGVVLLNFGDNAWTHGVYRVVETALGIAAALAVSFVPILLNVEPIESSENQPG